MKTRFILIFIISITFLNCKKDVKKIINSDTKEKMEIVFKVKNGKNCFKEVIENKIKKGKNTIIEDNKLIINLTIEGNKVHGNFDYIPFKEKVNKGNFTGTLDGNIAKTICVFNNEGKTKKEEVIFKIDATKISILGGEKDKIDGVWKFKDASKGFYMNEIPRINCN